MLSGCGMSKPRRIAIANDFRVNSPSTNRGVADDETDVDSSAHTEDNCTRATGRAASRQHHTQRGERRRWRQATYHPLKPIRFMPRCECLQSRRSGKNLNSNSPSHRTKGRSGNEVRPGKTLRHNEEVRRGRRAFNNGGGRARLGMLRNHGQNPRVHIRLRDRFAGHVFTFDENVKQAERRRGSGSVARCCLRRQRVEHITVGGNAHFAGMHGSCKSTVRIRGDLGTHAQAHSDAHAHTHTHTHMHPHTHTPEQ